MASRSYKNSRNTKLQRCPCSLSKKKLKGLGQGLGTWGNLERELF